MKPSPHTHTMWTEVSSSVPHFLQVGLLLSPTIYKCLLEMLCSVSRPITAPDCVLLKDNNRALVARSGPEISSQASLCVLQGPRHNTRCCFSIQHFIFSYILPGDTGVDKIQIATLWRISSLAVRTFKQDRLWDLPSLLFSRYRRSFLAVELSGTCG